MSPLGPDGCAIDFETSAVGTVVSGNYISHSWGAGIMVFGHTVRRGLNLVQLFNERNFDNVSMHIGTSR